MVLGQKGFSRFLAVFLLLVGCGIALLFPSIRDGQAGGLLIVIVIALSVFGVIFTLSLTTRDQRLRDALLKFTPHHQHEHGKASEDLEKSLSKLGEKLANTTSALEEERKGHETFLEVLSDGVAAVDEEGKVMFCNPAFKRLFDIPENRITPGTALMELVRQPGVINVYSKSVQSGQKQIGEVQVDAGNDFFLQVTATPMPPRSDGERRTLLVLHDISRQKMVERMRVDFVANVSHEIRTPLTAINGFVETLLDGAINDTQTAENFLKTIFKHTQRLNRLVDDILALSNIEMGAEKLRPAPMDPALFIKTVEQTFRNGAEKKKISIDLETDQNLPPLTADRDRLMQVMVNLVDNALKHTPEKGNITLECHHLKFTPEKADASPYLPLDGKNPFPEGENWEKSFIEFTVRDTGEGIPENSIHRLMERFYRVDKARSREMGGTGLGLAIVKHIIKAHFGSISIESRLEGGTEVKFIVPVESPLPSDLED